MLIESKASNYVKLTELIFKRDKSRYYNVDIDFKSSFFILV
jgi:hypothetical protein